MTFRFRRFRTRILFLFLGLLSLVQAASFYTVETANLRNAHQQIGESLETGARVFVRLVETRTRHLAESVRLLSSDFAFKSIVSTNDRASILAALVSYRQRSRADVIMVVSMEGDLLADTLHPDETALSQEIAKLISAAEEDEHGEAASLAFMEQQAYQMVVVPLLAPDPMAWIITGFLIDDRLARDLKRLTLADVSLLAALAEGRKPPFASTLPVELQQPLRDKLSTSGWQPDKSFSLTLEGDEEYVTLVTSLGKSGTPVLAVLQQPIEEKLRPFHRLNRILLALSLVGLLFSLAGGVWIAHTVTRPIATLAQGVNRIERGEYGHTFHLPYRDEIGELASAFNHMSQGLAEKDRVRDLLGKVVSPAIAHELLNKGISLGGEERDVTILFSDIRGFTTLSESLPPTALLDLLNVYLTEMSAIVEMRGGVVDKYVGDAVMALFGAPLSHLDDADRAILAALDMLQVLENLNRKFEQQGLPPLDIGIGINTGRVVAGNMGSQNRLNYTVIGDEVNLASRLESLTKEKMYATKIIISAATLQAACGAYQTRHLGEVIVKGKTRRTEIFALMGTPTPLPKIIAR